jgi:DNA-binding YbaB/EbfC family protein
MQQDMLRAQEELAAAEVKASSGGGLVTVTVTGALVVKEIQIAAAAIDPDDPELTGDLVLAAVNEAIRGAQALANERMGTATAGLDLGALGGLGLPGV